MRLNPTLNSVLNDIMAGDSTAVLLFASEKYNKVDFISELSSRYFKSFCFSAKTDDLHQLSVTLASRILSDDEELCTKLRQLLFCQSRYNGDKTVLNVVLDRVASLKREVLFVFEDLEALPKDFDYTYFFYMVKHAPQNLKILFSANEFLSIGLFGFEPKYPMLVDEDVLDTKESLYTYDEYLSDLSDDQIAFLTYVSDEDGVDELLIDEIYPEGLSILKYLSRKGVYVAERAHGKKGKIYMLDKGFRAYLKEITGEYAKYYESYADIPYATRFIDWMVENGTDHYDVLRFAMSHKSVESVEKIVYKILHCPKHIPKLTHFLKSHKELLKVADLSKYVEYPYVLAVQNFLWIVQGYDIDEAVERLKALKAYFKEKEDMLTYFITSAAECLAYDKLGDKEKVIELLNEADKFSNENQGFAYVGFVTKMLLPDFPRYLSLKPQEIEDLLNKEELKGAFWYLKMLEDLEFSYYSLGNYRKCMELAERLKETLPEYVIPPRHVAMIYYDNADMTMVEKKIDEALTFATENDLKEDIHMLYTAKSLVYAYRGEYKQSIEYSTLSLASVGKGDSYEKYFTIMERVWQHAKIGEHKYAQALANAYLAYTRAKAPEYVQFMASALAYTLYKMGRTELAYQLAKETIQLGANRSIAWLMSMGIATNHLLSRGELQDIDSLLSNLIRASHTHGMKMLIVDYANDVFAPILGYAQERNVEPEIIEEIMHAVRIKDGDKHVSADVKLKMFGNVSITAGGQEIQWKTRKSKDLFMHYVLAGKVGMDRSVILDLLWKDYLYESAINNLKTTNNIIRKTLDNYGIEYKLHYINSRYSITIENLDNEYERYRTLIENFNKENDYLHKAELMDQILKIYRADLCVDVNYPDFEHERTSVKQELIINMIKLIRGLAKAGEYVESKRFLNALMLIDGDNDYNHMVYELDRFINLTK